MLPVISILQVFYLGIFKTPEEAALAYDEGVQKYELDRPLNFANTSAPSIPSSEPLLHLLLLLVSIPTSISSRPVAVPVGI